jgi:hypothetical protein
MLPVVAEPRPTSLLLVSCQGHERILEIGDSSADIEPTISAIGRAGA